jgi:hypothetical protein
MKALRLSWLMIPVVAACSGEPVSAGVEEPIQVTGAQFREGRLPGTLSDGSEAEASVKPSVTSVELANRIAPQGYAGKAIRGRTSTDAVSVAMRLADAGSGYWIFNVGAPDPAFEGEYEWAAAFDIAPHAKPGLHDLLIAAIDPQGNAGTQSVVSLCITSEVPDNLNACDPTIAPPHTVVSLSWDAPVDLDLRVLTPSGKLVDAKRPTTAGVADGGAAAASAAGQFDRDSNAGCVVDGLHRENLVFQRGPEPGTYYVYASLYDACHQAAVRFNWSLHQAIPGVEPDTARLEQVYERGGVLLAPDAHGGSKVGFYAGKFVVQ